MRWALCTIIVLSVFQVTILDVSDDVYWYLYHTSSDILYLSLSLGLFNAISYTSVKNKALSSGIMIWFGYCAVSNFLTDYIFKGDILYTRLMVAFTVASLAATFMMRFLLRWRSSNNILESHYFYEVVGKPTNISQMAVAMYSGLGGAFGITDGIHLWHYSKNKNCMICEELEPSYLKGRMAKSICQTSTEKYNELNMMTGKKFTFMHNCIELHTLARKWR